MTPSIGSCGRGGEGGALAVRVSTQELERIVARPPIGEALARAASRPGGATTEQVVAAIRAVRDSR